MEPEIITEAQTWLTNNQGLIIEYAVNIAAALITLLVGYIAANLLSGGVVKVMQTRKLDTTVTHFVGSILKYTILVFVVIAALGRVGVQTASFVAIIGAAGLAIGLALQGSLQLCRRFPAHHLPPHQGRGIYRGGRHQWRCAIGAALHHHPHLG